MQKVQGQVVIEISGSVREFEILSLIYHLPSGSGRIPYDVDYEFLSQCVNKSAEILRCVSSLSHLKDGIQDHVFQIQALILKFFDDGFYFSG